MTGVIEALDLVKRFGSKAALTGLSVKVEAKEVYGLVGPDGAGKTTMLRILAGVMGPTSGTVKVVGHDPLSPKTTVRASLGYMPQQYSLYGDLSVEENLRFFARMFCLSRPEYHRRRDELLSITRLERFTERRADALSGGMYKKLALACSLLHRPRALILDEPTNGVDPVSRRELWTLFFELASTGMAILVSTAYMDEAARCHRVGLLSGGALMMEGTPSELSASLRHTVLRIRVTDPRAFEGLLRTRPEVLTTTLTEGEFRAVIRRGEEDTFESLLRREGATFSAAAPNLEELFLTAAIEAP